MAVGAIAIAALSDAVSSRLIAAGLAPSVILLSVVVAIVTQLWVKLNDLSGLDSLTAVESKRLKAIVTQHSNSLVWLIVFFVLYIYGVLAISATSGANLKYADAIVTGAGAGFGACVTLIAGVLFDLNEVAQFRWDVEIKQKAKKERESLVEELKTGDTGLTDDERLRSYNLVSE